MTKLISTFLSIFFLFNNISNAKCSYIDRKIKKAENAIYFENLELSFFYERLARFEDYITRKRVLLSKWECCYNNFESYLSNLSSDNKIMAGNYRFLKWLHITEKKLIGYKRTLNAETKQVAFEVNQINCLQKSSRLNNLQRNLDNESIYCKDILIDDVGNLNNRLNHLIELFNRLEQEAIYLIERSIEFRSRINALISSGRFENCCCWY